MMMFQSLIRCLNNYAAFCSTNYVWTNHARRLMVSCNNFLHLTQALCATRCMTDLMFQSLIRCLNNYATFCSTSYVWTAHARRLMVSYNNLLHLTQALCVT